MNIWLSKQMKWDGLSHYDTFKSRNSVKVHFSLGIKSRKVVMRTKRQQKEMRMAVVEYYSVDEESGHVQRHLLHW